MCGNMTGDIWPSHYGGVRSDGFDLSDQVPPNLPRVYATLCMGCHLHPRRNGTVLPASVCEIPEISECWMLIPVPIISFL